MEEKRVSESVQDGTETSIVLYSFLVVLEVSYILGCLALGFLYTGFL